MGHRTKSATWRWLTLGETRKLHGIPDTYKLSAEFESVTLSGELIGQGVIVTLFEKIIAATRTLGSKQLPRSTTALTEIRKIPSPQLGLCFA